MAQKHPTAALIYNYVQSLLQFQVFTHIWWRWLLRFSIKASATIQKSPVKRLWFMNITKIHNKHSTSTLKATFQMDTYLCVLCCGIYAPCHILRLYGSQEIKFGILIDKYLHY